MNEHAGRIVDGLIGSIPLLVAYLESRRRAKKKQDEQHAENQKVLRALVNQDKWLPAHAHDDKEGVLTVKNIRYAPENGIELKIGGTTP
jgi:hypothetical protein